MSDDDSKKAELDRLDQLVKAHANQLSEHFDAVQIFANKHTGDEEGTARVSWGTGNWYARYGHVHEWLVRQRERSRIEQQQDPDSEE